MVLITEGGFVDEVRRYAGSHGGRLTVSLEDYGRDITPGRQRVARHELDDSTSNQAHQLGERAALGIVFGEGDYAPQTPTIRELASRAMQ